MAPEDTKQVSGESTPDEGLPQPQFQDKTPASPTSAPSSEQILEALRPIIQAEAKKAAQSVKDVRFSELDKVKELLAQIKESGGTIPPALEQQVQMQDTIRRTLTEMGVAPVTDKSMSGATGANQKDDFNTVAELQAVGLDTSVPEVLNLVKDLGAGKFRNPDHFRAEAAKLALKLANPGQVTDTATNPPRGQLPPRQDEAALRAEYQKAVAPLRGNIEAVSQLQAEYRKKGLPI